MRTPEQITFAPTFFAWQNAARRALKAGLSPGLVVWEELGSTQPALAMFEEAGDRSATASPGFRVPRSFLEMAERIACHRNPRRWALLYRVLWRLTHGEPRLTEMLVDPEVNELLRLDKAVRHDVHKMRAFVRFRAVPHEGDTWYVAWFEPGHHIVERNAAFFRDRFAGMCWSILTPDRCVHWDGAQLRFTDGVAKSAAPGNDAVEELWRTYYSHIFNPARVKTKMMQSEMPKRYWKNLPETEVIPVLLERAPQRVARMLEASEAGAVRADEPSIAQPPETGSLETLRAAAAACRACPLWKNATQTVFGEGPHPAKIVLLGEQPGDAEDRAGQPFIGPAGKLLDQALVEAGLDRAHVYVTNVVKHFKWEPRGKRRLHEKPNLRDITACRPWFEAELRNVRPRVLICLGGTAATAIFGSSVRILRDRGQVRASDFAAHTVITFHPSALLRAPDEATREMHYGLFVEDLRLGAAAAGA